MPVTNSSNGRSLYSRYACLFSALLLLLIAIGGPSFARSTDLAAAEVAVERIAKEIQSGLTQSTREQRLASLTSTIENNTNVDLLSRLALGRHWRSLDEQQRREYQSLFRTAILGTFAGRLESIAMEISAPIEGQFQVDGSRHAGSNGILVRSRFKPNARASVTVDWLLRDASIVDLIIEGVSLLITQRAEFASVIERSDIDGLIEELQIRIGRLEQ